MKKNIKKPELADTDLAALAALINTIYQEMVRPLMKGAKWKMRRRVKKTFFAVQDGICEGGWETNMVAFLNKPSLDHLFRQGYDAAMQDAALYYEKTTAENADNIILGLRKVALVYEYITGKDIKTGKVLHRGVVDA
jgi:hypothetical protein